MPYSSRPTSSRAPRVALRLGLALFAATTAALASELVARSLARRPYAPPHIQFADHARDLGSTLPYLKAIGAQTPHVSPHSLLPGNLVAGQCYDRPRWAYFDDDGCVEARLNSLGFRDDEFPIEKPAGELRILAVGDSFTFGFGVRVEDCYVQRLERQLAAVHGQVQVINGGFAPGESSPAGYADWIEHDGLLLDPDVVLIGFCLNDMGDVPMAVIVPEPARLWLGGKSVLLHRIQVALHRHRLADYPLDLARPVERAPAQWLATQAGLTKVRDVCAARGVRLVVAVFPMIARLDERYPYRRLHAMVNEFCEREGIEHVDLLERFLGRDAAELSVHPRDQHPNHEGQRLIAEGLFEYFEGGR